MKLLRQIKFFIYYLFFISSGLYANDENLERVYRVLASLPNWDESQACAYELAGGLTNVNYRAHIGSSDYFVRSGLYDNSLLGVSLDKEWVCTSLASHAGLGPKTICYSPEEKILITGFIETGDRVIDLRNLISQQKFCSLVRSLHHSNLDFTYEFCPFKTIKSYIKNAQGVGVVLPKDLFNIILPWMDRFQVDCYPMFEPVPGHFDLHHGNILDDGERFWLIDWEYAGMGDPFFDLSTAASLENYTDDEMREILQIYLEGRPPTEEEISYFYFMRVLADVRWSLWCYLQSKISPRVDLPFLPFGEFFLNNALDRLEIRLAP